MGIGIGSAMFLASFTTKRTSILFSPELLTPSSLATKCGPRVFPLVLDQALARELGRPFEELVITKLCLGGLVLGYSRFSQTFPDTVGMDQTIGSYIPSCID